MNTFQDLFETRYLGERVAMVFQLIPVAVTASMLAAACIVIAFWNSPSQLFVAYWGALVTLSNFARMVYYWVKRLPGAVPVGAQRGHRQILISSMMGGLLWGAAPVLLYPGELTLEFLFVVFVMGGLASGIVGAFIMVPMSVIIWLCCTVLPTAVILFVDTSLYPVSALAGFILVVYAVLLLVSGFFNFRTLMDSLRLRNLNRTLAKSTQLAAETQDEWIEELAVMNRRLGSETRARASAQKGLAEAERKILISAQTVLESHGLNTKLDSALVKLMDLEALLENDPSNDEVKTTVLRLRKLLQDAASHSQKVLDMTTQQPPGSTRFDQDEPVSP